MWLNRRLLPIYHVCQGQGTGHFPNGSPKVCLADCNNVPLRGVLHAEQSFDHLAPVHVGDRIEVSRKVVDIHDKKNGALTFILVDTHYRRAGQPVARSRQTILVRNALEAA